MVMEGKQVSRAWYLMPCVWIAILLHLIGSALHAGIVPTWLIPIATWAIIEIGTIGSIFYPGIARFQERINKS